MDFSELIFGPDPDARARRKMESDAAVHEQMDVLESLNEEQSKAVLAILGYIRTLEEPHAQACAAYYAGFIARARQQNHGICGACHQNHDDLASELLADTAEPGE